LKKKTVEYLSHRFNCTKYTKDFVKKQKFSLILNDDFEVFVNEKTRKKRVYNYIQYYK